MLIVESQSLDVYRNLAIEEYLMDEVTDRGPVLFLWRSREAVVMGKNQNPWCECRLGLMKKEGVPLARRVSGGGTVYHDEGNLNYCVITSREEYKEPLAYELVFQSLATFGIRPEKTGKSNLSVDGLKFSGNAFAFRGGRALHHGTLLLETDLVKLNRYLGSMFDGIETKAIASVPANVANLNVDRKELSVALKAAFRSLYAEGPLTEWTEADIADNLIAANLARQVSGDWKYAKTPKFALEIEGERVEVAGGRVLNGRFAGADFGKIVYSRID